MTVANAPWLVVLNDLNHSYHSSPCHHRNQHTPQMQNSCLRKHRHTRCFDVHFDGRSHFPTHRIEDILRTPVDSSVEMGEATRFADRAGC